MNQINVTKTYLPPFDEYTAILKRAWDKGWLTNNGELVQELEAKLKEYLGVKYLFFCSNGTVVMQMAIKALGLTKEIITTPFSYVATANAIVWAGCTPVFADIEPDTLTIDPKKIEAAITENTEAILATHVFGFPCKIEAIQAIADKHKLKVVYDGAHTFGCLYHNKSLLNYGDVSTCSFHATKLFHTVEGGCIITNDDTLAENLRLSRQFGHIYDDYYQAGINGKNSELHAAMGLAVWPYVTSILTQKKEIAATYASHLPESVQVISGAQLENFSWNYSYYPVLFSDEKSLLSAKALLSENGYHARRYFFPSLNTLSFLGKPGNCTTSESVAERILCLPNGTDVTETMIIEISRIIKSLFY